MHDFEAGYLARPTGTLPLGEEKQLAILFSDINGYTPFCERLSPGQVIGVLDEYFELMGGLVQRQGGQIIDYFGDGMLAVFGLIGNGCPVQCAVRAGRQMQGAMEMFNQSLRALYPQSLSTRIGIHYGQVIVGRIGTAQVRKVAVIGDAVNLASRIERMNKQLQTRLLVSECAYQRVPDWIGVTRPFQVEIRGKTGLYTLHQPLLT